MPYPVDLEMLDRQIPMGAMNYPKLRLGVLDPDHRIPMVAKNSPKLTYEKLDADQHLNNLTIH